MRFVSTPHCFTDPPSMPRREALLGGAAAVAAPLAMWTTFLLAARLRAGYDALRAPASELGQMGSSGAWMFNLGFFVGPGLLTIGLAVVISTIGPRRWARLGASLMLGVGGLSLIASGLVPMSPDSAQITFWHRFAGLPLITVLPAGILLMGAVLPAEPEWRLARALSGVAGSALIGLIAVYRLGFLAIPDGVFQRAGLLVLTCWFLALGLSLIHSYREKGAWPEGRAPSPYLATPASSQAHASGRQSPGPRAG